MQRLGRRSALSACTEKQEGECVVCLIVFAGEGWLSCSASTGRTSVGGDLRYGEKANNDSRNYVQQISVYKNGQRKKTVVEFKHKKKKILLGI